MTTLFAPEWLEPVAVAPVVVATVARRTWRRERAWRQTTLTLATPVTVPQAAQPTKVSRRAVLASPAMLARAEKRRREAGDRDGWAVVVIVVPPTRGHGAFVEPNVPDYLGRVAFTATGYGRKSIDNFAEVKSFVDYLTGMGREWRMGP